MSFVELERITSCIDGANTFDYRRWLRNRQRVNPRRCQPSVAIDKMGLETEPARVLAQAFQDYGAYVVGTPRQHASPLELGSPEIPTNHAKRL